MMTDGDRVDPAALSARLARVRERIAAAEQRWGRPPGAVRLLAVSKRQPSESIRIIHAAGQRAFGESYLPEAQARLGEVPDDIEWHFIGPVQSNKTRGIAELFSWVHSVDREKILQRLSDQRPATLPPLACLIQVRIGNEPGKSGASPAEVEHLAALARSLPRLQLRGLMCIPPPSEDVETQRGWFRQLRELFQRVDGGDPHWDTLSMGMSNDLEAAIAEGSTLVRVGTDIFGPRA